MIFKELNEFLALRRRFRGALVILKVNCNILCINQLIFIDGESPKYAQSSSLSQRTGNIKMFINKKSYISIVNF